MLLEVGNKNFFLYATYITTKNSYSSVVATLVKLTW